MEKRLILAMVLSAGLLLGWNVLFPPPKPAPTPDPTGAVQSESGDRERDRRELDPMANGDSGLEGDEAGTELPAVRAATQQAIVIETAYHVVEFTNRGGAVRNWKVRWRDEALPVFPIFAEDDVLPMQIELDDLELQNAINEALFTVERGTGPDGNGERVVFRWSDGRGVEVTKAFVFYQDRELVDVKIDVVDRGRRKASRLALGPGFGAQDPGRRRGSYYYEGSGIWRVDGRTTHRKERKLRKDPSQVSGEIRWAGVEDQYFAALVLPREWPAVAQWRALERTPVALDGEDDEKDDETEPQTILSVTIPADGAQLFIGPKHFARLQALGSELETAVWFSSNRFLYGITKFIFFGLVWIQERVINWGVAILLATLTLRILLFPVNQYSMVRMKKTQIDMQRLQPKLKAIQAKFKKKKDAQSRQQMQQEQMELYKREGVNPMGGITGCLPLLAQFPILIGFYNMLTVAVELRGANFALWISDLSQKDAFYIIPILMGISMFVQQKMAMSKVKDPQQQQQQKIMMVMPFVFTYICMQMPAGMVLYWFMNNLLGIGQQWLVNKKTVGLEATAQKA
ncbi:MAG: membrane protein insertase YidC [Acidobacteriota bacterium]|nr:membrane protein insertase YidC [Acidobacteriota bacterium]MDH3783881.1 membrane protein insertase YidC [Acidobacteriota bacterium]